MENTLVLSDVSKTPEAFNIEGTTIAEFDGENEIYTIKSGIYTIDVNDAEIKLVGGNAIKLQFGTGTKLAHVDVTEFSGQFTWDPTLAASFSEGSISLTKTIPEKAKAVAKSGTNAGKSTPNNYDIKRFL